MTVNGLQSIWICDTEVTGRDADIFPIFAMCFIESFETLAHASVVDELPNCQAEILSVFR